jgi:hypothetical protein
MLLEILYYYGVLESGVGANMQERKRAQRLSSKVLRICDEILKLL